MHSAAGVDEACQGDWEGIARLIDNRAFGMWFAFVIPAPVRMVAEWIVAQPSSAELQTINCNTANSKWTQPQLPRIHLHSCLIAHIPGSDYASLEARACYGLAAYHIAIAIV